MLLKFNTEKKSLGKAWSNQSNVTPFNL